MVALLHMRPRGIAVKLPNLHRKGNAYYFVAGTKPRKWIALGSDLQTALRRYERLRNKSTSGTLGAMLEAWLQDPPTKLSAGTAKVYRTYAANVSRVFGELYPDEVSRAEVLLYLDRCPRTTGAHEIMLLRRVYERALRRGEASENPCIGAKREGGTVRARRDRLLTAGEIAAIRSNAAPVLQVAIDLAVATSLRPGDLCRLRWGELETGVRTRKTGARLAFEMTDDLRAILDSARALQGRVSCLTVLSERSRPLAYGRLRDLWSTARDAAGVADAQFRDLRAVSASARPEDAQQRLGHTTPNMTRTYLRGRQVTKVRPI